MSNSIFEEDNKEGSAPAGGMDTAQKKIEKQARELVYNIRYDVKQEIGDKQVAPAIMKQLLLKRWQKSSSASNIKLSARRMLFGEDYIGDIGYLAAGTIANAMFKVFVEKTQISENIVVENIENEYLKEMDEKGERKYKVRVTDKKTGNSYIRYATREKITQLRTNPNIQSVEITEYGEPREGERKGGEDTARATGGGKAKRDYDGDGKVESGGKEHAGAVHNAIQRKRGLPADGKDTSGIKEELVGGQKKIDVAAPYGKLTGDDFKKLRKTKKNSVDEEFIADAASTDKDANTTKIDIMKKGKTNKISVFPPDSTTDRQGTGPRGVNAHYEPTGEVIAEMAKSKSQARFMRLVNAYKKGKLKTEVSDEVKQAAKSMTTKAAHEFAVTKDKGLPEKVKEETCSSETEQRDKRGDYAKVAIVKNKMRAMGIKNPVVMVASEGTFNGGTGLSLAASQALGKVFANSRTSEAEATKAAQRNITDPISFAIKGALGASGSQQQDLLNKRRPQTPLQKQIAARTQQVVNQSYEPDGEVIDERTRERQGQPRPARNRAMEIMRTMPSYRQGGMTRSGGTIAGHEEKRGVKKDRTSPVQPQTPVNPPAKKLAAKKAQVERQRNQPNPYRSREGESD